MEQNLPATGTETALAAPAEPVTEATPRTSPPLTVALLPLALTAFAIVAIAIAAWTVLAAP